MRFGSQAWIWLNAAAVGLCLCTLTGLLLLIAVRGLGHFWPADLQLYVYLDDAGATRRVLGELIETETVSRRQHLESGVAHNLVPGDGPLRRLVIKTGNRRLDPPDFAHIFEHRIESVSAPPDAVVLERVEWGQRARRSSGRQRRRPRQRRPTMASVQATDGGRPPRPGDHQGPCGDHP